MSSLHTDALVQGAQAALQAYTHASDAYAEQLFSSVAFWSVLIAPGLVLLEWALGRGRRGH